MGVSTSMKPRASSCAPQTSDDLARACTKISLRFRIRDQVQIALAVADFDVFQAVPFLRHGQQNLRKERELLGVNAQLAGAGAEQIAFDADDVAQIEHFVQLVFALRNRVLADIDLQALARLLQVQEAGLAHAAHGLDAAGDARPAACRAKFLGGLRAVFAENLRNGMREIEPLAVGAESERFNLGGAVAGAARTDRLQGTFSD